MRLSPLCKTKLQVVSGQNYLIHLKRYFKEENLDCRKQGNMNHPRSPFLESLTFEADRYRSAFSINNPCKRPRVGFLNNASHLYFLFFVLLGFCTTLL